MSLKLKAPRTWDIGLAIAVILLVIFGTVIIYSITYNQETNFVLNQLLYAGVGVTVLLGLTFLDYRALGTATISLYILGVIALLLLLIPGIGKEIGGSTRWYDLGFVQFQPSEIFKIILIITLAKYYSSRATQLKLRHLFEGLLITLIPAVLVVLEPDLGTTLVYFVIYFVILFSTASRKIYFYIISAFSVIVLPLVWFFVLQGYQQERILSFLNPQNNPFGSGYSVLQSIIATGSGSLFGRGLGHGPQSQLNFLPAQETDFIFASTAEQLGFIGALVLLGLLFIVIFKAITISRLSRDQFGAFVATGIVGMLVFQVVVNVGMNVGLMPITGIPLPFVSYGGSSLITSMVAIGILESIHMRHKPISFL